MINTEMVENPVLEEVEEALSTLDERAGKEGDRERSAEETAAESERVEKDPFDEIDFGSYFQDYLDPGFRTTSNFEEYEKPSFENFLSQPSTLTDHLMWQLGALTLAAEVRSAAELLIGNLNEDGYLTATEEELVEVLLQGGRTGHSEPIPFERGAAERATSERAAKERLHRSHEAEEWAEGAHEVIEFTGVAEEERAELRALIETALGVVHQLDPVGIGARDLRECLLLQIAAQERDVAMMSERRERYQAAKMLEEEDADLESLAAEEETPHTHAEERNGQGAAQGIYATATHIVANCLAMLQKKDMRELTRSCGRSAEAVQTAVDLIRTLDPRPGQRYNQGETRLIEPDVAFVKRDDKYVVVMNEEDMPTLRLNQGYRKMLRQKQTEKDVRDYVKERYKSAIQLLRNIEQRKNTIVRTCEVIVRRQAEFLERGEEALRPMMIKDVAEEIGVHPSTVSRAVANKYVHTAQGVYELRFFFTEGVNGPEGGDMPLVLLKRKVKKLIEEEDARKPLTDDQLAAELQRQGIQVTRRTVAKYREDMQIPSTHQRRVR
jgi:RNA polymerase sigma-54 factor